MSQSDSPVPGSSPGIHSTPADTRERTYDRAREGGLTRDAARKVADEVTRTIHDRRGR